MNPPGESTVLRRLLTGSAMSMVNMIVGIVIGLFMTPFLLHNLGDRQMGMWILVGSFTGFYGLLDFGVTSAISRYLTLNFSKNDIKACNSFASIGFYIFFVVGTVAAIISSVIALILYLTYNREVDDIGIMSWVIIILGINFMIDFPLRVFNGIITGCLRHDLNNLRRLIFRILGASLTFGIVYSGGKIIEMSLGSLLISVLSAISFYYLAKKVFPQLHLSPKSVRKEDFKPLFKYSFFTSLASITDALRFRISGIVIAGFLSVDVIAHYGIASTLVSYFQQTMGHCTMWLTNWFTRLDAKNDYEAIQKHTMFAYKITVLLATFIAFGLIFWSIPFITRWVGPKFLDAYDSLVLLTLGMMFAMWQSPTTRVLYATANHRYYAAVNAIDAVLNVTLTLVLVPRYGMVGVAIGNCVAMFVSKMFILPQVIIRILQISNARYWTNLGASLMKSIICLILPYIITQKLVAPEYKWLFINGTVCAIIYFSSAFLLMLTKEERNKLIDLAYKKRKIKKNEAS